MGNKPVAFAFACFGVVQPVRCYNWRQLQLYRTVVVEWDGVEWGGEDGVADVAR